MMCIANDVYRLLATPRLNGSSALVGPGVGQPPGLARAEAPAPQPELSGCQRQCQGSSRQEIWFKGLGAEH